MRDARPDSADLHFQIAAAYRRHGRFQEALAEFRKATELSPRWPDLPREIGATLVSLRKYDEAIQYFDRSIAEAPDQTVAYGEKAFAQLASTGSLEDAEHTFQNSPIRRVVEPRIFMVTLDTYRRDYRKALSALLAFPALLAAQNAFLPRALVEADLLRLLDDRARARAKYEEARLFLERERGQRPLDARVHSALGRALAGLGRKTDAIAEAKKGLELLPPSKDALVGPTRVEDLARVYVMVGEHDAALDEIEHLLALPTRFSIKLLELDPVWDPLRSHVRYAALIKKWAKPR